MLRRPSRDPEDDEPEAPPAESREEGASLFRLRDCDPEGRAALFEADAELLPARVCPILATFESRIDMSVTPEEGRKLCRRALVLITLKLSPERGTTTSEIISRTTGDCIRTTASALPHSAKRAETSAVQAALAAELERSSSQPPMSRKPPGSTTRGDPTTDTNC